MFDAITLSVSDCFNSQRDGILRIERINSKQSVLVSIPNGMEFYSTSRSALIKGLRFQFPTGWNSTVVQRQKRSKMPSFNSQRDGILLCADTIMA